MLLTPLLGMVFLLSTTLMVSADPAENTPVEFLIGDLKCRAHNFELDPESDSLEFEGDVTITKDSMVMAAEQVYIDLKNNGGDTEELNAGSFSRIVATGKVNINFGNSRATSDSAVYDAAAETLALSGIPATYASTENTITADVIKVTLENEKAMFTELLGNATITHGSTLFTADYAKIVFSDTPHENTPQTLDANSIEAFIATGNVKIEIKNGMATSEKAVYDSGTKLFTLSGPASYVRGKNTMTAPEGIILDIENGTIRANGSREQPVEGVVFPESVE